MTSDELAKFPLLDSLSELEREAVAEELAVEEHAAGVTLFRAGDHADGAWFVAAGGVRVRAEGIEAAADFGAGEVLGTLSLVIDGPREASAETLSRTTLWRLSRSGYRRLAEGEPAGGLPVAGEHPAGICGRRARRGAVNRRHEATALVDLKNTSH